MVIKHNKNNKNKIKKQLDIITEEIKRCPQCKEGKFGLPVPGEGREDTEIMFIGEAPGRKEAETGKPFVGRAGKLLSELLISIGVDRKDVYITSPVKYYPGKRTPKISEIKHGTIHLHAQIEAIDPNLIVLLGKVAHQALLGEMKMSKMHGQLTKKNSRLYFSTFHPAAALRFPKIKKLIKKDFTKLKRIYEKKSYHL